MEELVELKLVQLLFIKRRPSFIMLEFGNSPNSEIS